MVSGVPVTGGATGVFAVNVDLMLEMGPVAVGAVGGAAMGAPGKSISSC